MNCWYVCERVTSSFVLFGVDKGVIRSTRRSFGLVTKISDKLLKLF